MPRTRVKSCTFKRPFLTETEAAADIKRIRKRGRLANYMALHAYKCDFCPYWHMGHSKQQEHRRMT